MINLFEVEQDIRPKQSFDVVGRFRAGHQVKKRPMSLSDWRVTSDDPDVTAKVAELYGGTSQTWDNERQPHEVFTSVSSVKIVLEKSFSGMTLWGRNAPIRKCDGATLSYPEDQVGEACECAKFNSIADRKAAADKGTGCQPDITLRFRLAEAYNLGTFEFKTGSWGMAREINDIEATLAKFGGTAVGTLTLEPVEFTNSEGQLRKYTKTVVDLTGAYTAA